MNIRHASVSAAVVLLAALPGALDAQTCRRAAPGTPVRFVHDPMAAAEASAPGTPTHPWRGRREYRDATFTRLDGDTLRVMLEGVPAAFPAREVTRFQVECPVSAGTSLGLGLTRGALVGGAAGLIMGLCNPKMDIFGDEGACEGPTSNSVTGATAAGAVAGAILGTVLGGLSALLSNGTEWQTVSLVTAPPAAGISGEWEVGVRIPLRR